MMMMLVPWILLAGALGAIGVSLLRGRRPRRQRPPRDRDSGPQSDGRGGQEPAPIRVRSDDGRSQAVAVLLPAAVLS
ncbi:MAG: hypothetical protein M0030_14150 [Actinomycetota bacterium]|jgi:hypothetical protein|nr:hypothetical protein [Actinomycetota bacterium]